MSNTFDFEAFKAQEIEQLKAGVPLLGKDGVYTNREGYSRVLGIKKITLMKTFLSKLLYLWGGVCVFAWYFGLFTYIAR